MDPLSPDEQREVLTLLHVAERHARRFARSSGPTCTDSILGYDDYYAAGVVALCDCVRRKDPRRTPEQFLSYCDTRVCGAIKNLIRSELTETGVSSAWAEDPRSRAHSADVEDAADLLAAHGITPTTERISVVLRLDPDTVDRSRQPHRRERVDVEPDTGMGWDDLRNREVLLAVAKLPEPLQETVRLRYFTGLSIREVSDVLHLSPSGVKWRLRMAHEQLGRELSDDYGWTYDHTKN